MNVATEVATDTKQPHELPDLAVVVITHAGIYPDEDDFRRARASEKIADVLALAKEKLEITNTNGWVAHIGNRQLNVDRTFHQEGLSGIVEIEWHKEEGGGGA